MREVIHSIPAKLEVAWDPGARAVIDTWSSYAITLDQFRDAVMGKGLTYAKSHRARAWIVDSSTAHGAFPQEVQAFIGSDVFPAFAANGINYFLTIVSKSAVTNISIQDYTSKLGPHGIQLVEVPSVDMAVEWLSHHP